MYKIGLTYKRMDIYFNELRQEFEANSKKHLGGLRKDLEHVNEGIQQVHDELEANVSETKKLQLKTEKDVNLLIKSNEQMLSQTNQWRQDIASMAMVQSCQAEYITMQSVLESQCFKLRCHMQQAIDSHASALSQTTAEPVNQINSIDEHSVQMQSPAGAPLDAKIGEIGVAGQAQKIDFDSSQLSQPQVRNNYGATQTDEIVSDLKNAMPKKDTD